MLVPDSVTVGTDAFGNTAGWKYDGDGGDGDDGDDDDNNNKLTMCMTRPARSSTDYF